MKWRIASACTGFVLVVSSSLAFHYGSAWCITLAGFGGGLVGLAFMDLPNEE